MKPRIVKKKGPRIVDEEDYSLIIEKAEDPEKDLRRKAYQDITPVKREEVLKGEGLIKKLKKRFK